MKGHELVRRQLYFEEISLPCDGGKIVIPYSPSPEKRFFDLVLIIDDRYPEATISIHRDRS